ncbi:MAG: hypothetical protein ABIJ08_03125 [Nanoarchaeota archaeon]
MINKTDFDKIRSHLEDYDKKREELIKKARDVLKISKQLIYSMHRKDMQEADSLLKQVKKEKSALDKITSANKRLLYEGSYSEACQEYVEALSYHSFIKSKEIPAISSLSVSEEDYLMGISDLTGEVTRKAVTIANKEPKEVEEIKLFVEEVFGEFLKFNLRNSELRRKSDSIKWNLKKLEELLYDINKK